MPDQSNNERTYPCNCAVCMRGGRTEPKQVKLRTFNAHAKNRNLPGSYAEFRSQQPHFQAVPSEAGPLNPPLAPEGTSAQSTTSTQESSVHHKRPRLDAENGVREKMPAEESEHEGDKTPEGAGNGGEDGNEREDDWEDMYEPHAPLVPNPPALQFEDDENETLPDRGSLADLNNAGVDQNENGGQPNQLTQPDPPFQQENAPYHNPELFPEATFEVEATLDELRIVQKFIAAIRGASLDEDNLPDDVIERLRTPAQNIIDFDEEEEVRTGIELFIDTNTASEDVFNRTRDTFHRSMDRKGVEYNPIPTLYEVKQRIKNITGVHSIVTDMCLNSCIAYSGPFSDLETCPKCREPRYNPEILAASNGNRKVPQRLFHTIPLGPQLQALWRTPEGATAMRYRREKTAEMRQKAAQSADNTIQIDEWEDIFHGKAYLDAVLTDKITDNDMVLLMSIDGAQLYQSKQSDCWIYIWVILDLPPDQRYKKRHIIPGGFIPGPNKPQNVDSFLFPGFHHAAALMKEGLVIYDALTGATFTSKIFLILGTADGPGLVYLNGLTGHSGAYGCRLYCSVKGRRKDGGSHYYPALSKPRDPGYSVEGSDHPDINATYLPIGATADYLLALNRVLGSTNPAQHRQNRKATGITKPSIFSAFPPDRTLPVPQCFGTDLMHLISLNIPDLLLALWRGTLECDPADDRTTWDWAVFRNQNIWKGHGQRVADTRPFLPGSFDRPPRNPAEKISSGYKAWEFLTYIFGLGPGLFHEVLPLIYWKNLCKLVAGVRLLHQRVITKEHLIHAHKLLFAFVTEFENIYYQQKASRLHFCRQSIHALLHLAPEVHRMGPGNIYTQWALERTIGNLGEEIRQPSNPFANLSERGVRRAQVNSIIAILPDLEPKKPLSRTSQDLGNGYILSMPDKCPRPISVAEKHAIRSFYLSQNQNIGDVDFDVTKWARLFLPNRQYVRTAWKEKSKPLYKVRMSRNIMFDRSNDRKSPEFAEVQYFFQVQLGEHSETVALISRFGAPDPDLLAESSGALLVCQYQGIAALEVISVSKISSCIAMIPFKLEDDGRFFVCEKMGLDVAFLGGAQEDEE